MVMRPQGTLPTGVQPDLGVEQLDHTAIAVRSIEAALPLYRDLLGGTPTTREEFPDRGFSYLTLRYPNGAQIELLEPAGEGGFLRQFLDKRGEGAHHITFIVRDLRQAVER